MPTSMNDESLFRGVPPDATCYEHTRDRILLFYTHPAVSRILILLAVAVSLCVVGTAAVICWACLGLFFGVPNGGHATLDVCKHAESWNETFAEVCAVARVSALLW
jgi:hypothetical protein